MMKTRNILFSLSALALASLFTLAGCKGKSTSDNSASAPDKAGGPHIGEAALGGLERPKPTPQLQALIDETVPKFRQNIYVDSKGDSLQYNLLTPEGTKEGEKYPLVLFMADASTPGPNPLTPLIQGYGGLVWATPDVQKKDPCYVLVPQYSYITVDNQWQTMPEVDETIELLKDLLKKNPIDTGRLYVTGQSMGCMMALYFNIHYPNLFAASMFVSGQWDVAEMDGFKDKKFAYITAAGDATSTGGATQLKALLKKEGASFSEATWSARLPLAEQDTLAAKVISENDERFFITFEGNTVLPEAKASDPGPGMVHMASFDFAYRLAPVTSWLLQQHK